MKEWEMEKKRNRVVNEKNGGRATSGQEEEEEIRLVQVSGFKWLVILVGIKCERVR